MMLVVVVLFGDSSLETPLWLEQMRRPGDHRLLLLFLSVSSPIGRRQQRRRQMTTRSTGLLEWLMLSLKDSFA
jgi:hypothetical protein